MSKFAEFSGRDSSLQVMKKVWSLDACTAVYMPTTSASLCDDVILHIVFCEVILIFKITEIGNLAYL